MLEILSIMPLSVAPKNKELHSLRCRQNSTVATQATENTALYPKLCSCFCMMLHLIIQYKRLKASFQTPIFSWAELNSNLDRPKCTKVRLLFQTPNLKAVLQPFLKHFQFLLQKYVIIIYAFGSAHEKFGVWNKAVSKLFQSRNIRPSQAKERLSHSKLK